jgi:hypothetical protein
MMCTAQHVADQHHTSPYVLYIVCMFIVCVCVCRHAPMRLTVPLLSHAAGMIIFHYHYYLQYQQLFFAADSV